MNSKYIIITLFALLSLFSVIAYANTKPNGLPAPIYPDLRSPIDKKIAQLDTLSGKVGQMSAEIDEIKRTKGGATVTVSKNYPVVPYDPNHPNVKKQSSFAIKANAKTLASRFGRGLNAAALGYAVVELIGEGIDWVLDPTNNSIRYDAPDGYMWKSAVFDNGGRLYPTPQLAAQGNCEAYSGCTGVARLRKLSDESYQVLVSTRNIDETPAWTVDRVKVTQEQSMSLDTIASHVINNEDNSTTNIITNNYYNTVNETLIEQIEKGEHDPQIKSALDDVNTSPPNTDTNTNNDTVTKPDATTTPTTLPPEVPEIGRDEDKPFELPAFCDWAKHVCDFIDWMKIDPPSPQEMPKIPINEIDADDYDINPNLYNSNVQCPTPIQVNIGMGVISIPYDSLCLFFTKNSPLIVAIAYLIGGFIVMGRR